MMRSLFSGISGLKTHQTRMDVIGNNIANVNTTAYKSMQVNFSDVMYQTTQAATGPNPEKGTAGMNPKQIGLGVQTAAIATKISEQGATQSTGNPFDLKISGDEFFIVSNGAGNYFTRDGSFYVDALGNLAMSSTGYNVMGWQVDETTGNIKKDTVSPIIVMSEDNTTYPAEWTTQATAAGIVDWYDDNQSEKAGKAMNLQIYDKLGYSYTVKLSLHNGYQPKTVKENYSYYAVVDDILNSQGESILDTQEKKDAIKFGTSGTHKVSEPYGVNAGLLSYDDPAAATQVTNTFDYVDTDGNTHSISVLLYDSANDVAGGTENTNTFFDKDGKLRGNPDDTCTLITVNSSPAGATAPTLTYGEVFSAIYGKSIKPEQINAASIDITTGTITVNEKNIEKGTALTYSGKDGSFMSASGGDATESTVLDLSALGDAFTSITIDFSKTLVSDNKGKSTIGMEAGDVKGRDGGRALGKLQGVSIQTNGMIYASYSNNQTKLLGQIAVAKFANPAGLQKEGENLYSSTMNSGEFDGIGNDISETGDKMNTGVLEMSNVDLSSEFTDMITTQRGFQANSRIITVSDTLLEELVNLKR